MIKCKHLISTGDYEHIELELEHANAEEAIMEYDRLKALYKQKAPEDGMNVREWAKVRRILMTTGEFDPNRGGELSQYQRDWISDTKNTYRDLQGLENNED
jgi:hypothetical protein